MRIFAPIVIVGVAISYVTDGGGDAQVILAVLHRLAWVEPGGSNEPRAEGGTEMLKRSCAHPEAALPPFPVGFLGIQLRESCAATHPHPNLLPWGEGEAACYLCIYGRCRAFCGKAHHLEGGFSIFHWILGVGVEKSEKIAVSRGARLRDTCAALHVTGQWGGAFDHPPRIPAAPGLFERTSCETTEQR